MKSYGLNKRLLSLSAATVLALAGCGSSNDATDTTTSTGVAIDGLLSGSTVCIDVNLNGICESNEDNTTTNSSGEYTLRTTQTGPLLVVGGDDLGTGLPFTGSLKAPQNSSVITPLTSAIQGMIENGYSQVNAEESVKKALDINSSVKLTKFNPLTEINGTNSVNAKKVLEKQAELQTIIHGVATTIANTDTSKKTANIMGEVFKEFSKNFNNATGEVPLTSDKLETAINNVASNLNISNQHKTTITNIAGSSSSMTIAMAKETANKIKDANASNATTVFNDGMKKTNNQLVSDLNDTSHAIQHPYIGNVPTIGSTLPYMVLDNTINNGAGSGNMEIRNGGYGSAAAADPKNPNRFYALTDRGPNADYTGSNGAGKMFPTPDYTPRIGHFEIQENGSVVLLKEILLKDTSDHNITGLPNPIAVGGTGEIPYDKNGNTLKNSDDSFKTDIFGLDSEGLAVLNDGTFWVSDEYGPHMVHFDATGKEIGRINPFVDDNRTIINLPKEFKNRRANRGMEGLTITPDQKTLVGIMQSTISNPTKAVNKLDITRIVTVNLETNTTSQYLYKQDIAENSNSEIVALTNDSFLVIERDGSFYKDKQTGQKYIYKINLSSGTNLETVETNSTLVQDEALGLTINGKTLEQAVLDANKTWDTLSANGIVPVSKTLVVDMVSENQYPHDKMEGLIVFNEHKLGILNDDDFATWATSGVLEQKYLDTAKTKIDTNTLYIVDVNLSDSKVGIPALTKLGSYKTGIATASEIVAYDKASHRMFSTNGAANKIDIINISDVKNPTLVSQIDLSTYGTGVNSITAKNGKIAVAVEVKSTDGLLTNSKGKVVFFDTDGTYQQQVEVGYLPDMVTFNEDGTKVVVANEGEPNGDYSVDPIGSIGIINVADGSYVDVNFTGTTLTNATDGTPVRLGGTPSNDQAKDIEPEYIAVSGNYAYVTLQENNAMAKVNLTTNSLEYVKSYGAKSWESNSNNTIDILEEGTIDMKSYQGLFGLYMPDSIAAYDVNGATYVVTANEGDGREYPIADVNSSLETGDALTDEIKIGKLFKNGLLDSSIASQFTKDTDLKVVTDMGKNSTSNKYEKLYSYGARSFSIWDANGNQIFDSGDEIERKVALYEPTLFNQDVGQMDGRSGNKGAEPEALCVGTIDGKTYAFIGLERQNAIMVYDITIPAHSKFVDYYKTGIEGDVSAEGMKFIPATDSPNGKNLLLVAYEGSGSTVVYEINDLK